jgi:DNA-binding NtrC family response regulator
VVDDDAVVADATGLLLTANGFDVRCVDSSDRARCLMDEGLRPDLLVTDFRLPGMTGIELIDWVHGRFEQVVPAILITGDTSAVEVANFDRSGCSVMHKPIEPQRFLSLIRQSLD